MKDWLPLVVWIPGVLVITLNVYLAKTLLELKAKMEEWTDLRYVRKDVFEAELRRLEDMRLRTKMFQR